MKEGKPWSLKDCTTMEIVELLEECYKNLYGEGIAKELAKLNVGLLHRELERRGCQIGIVADVLVKEE